MSRLTDQAWCQIAGAVPRGVRGKVFRMSQATCALLARERGHLNLSLSLYSVPVLLTEEIPYGEIRLEDR